MRMSEQLAMINRFRRTAPVDVETLSQALGVPVHYAFLDPDISGMLEKIGDDKFKITVNAQHPKTRQRFTIAHELGHYMLHRRLIGNGIDETRAYRSAVAGVYRNTAIGPVQETEANKFAVNVLMPLDLIQKYQRESGVNSPAQIARHFGVSEQSMCIRLGVPYEPEQYHFPMTAG